MLKYRWNVSKEFQPLATVVLGDRQQDLVRLSSPGGRSQSLPASPDEYLANLTVSVREGRGVPVI